MRIYNHKNYQEAADLFFVINTFKPIRYNVWIALGLAEKKLEHWQDALYAFSVAALANLENPLAFLYSAECYVALGLSIDAQGCAEKVLELLKNTSDDESRAIIEHLSKVMSLRQNQDKGNL